MDRTALSFDLIPSLYTAFIDLGRRRCWQDVWFLGAVDQFPELKVVF
jgi:hypothetical protein